MLLPEYQAPHRNGAAIASAAETLQQHPQASMDYVPDSAFTVLELVRMLARTIVHADVCMQLYVFEPSATIWR